MIYFHASCDLNKAFNHFIITDKSINRSLQAAVFIKSNDLRFFWDSNILLLTERKHVYRYSHLYLMKIISHFVWDLILSMGRRWLLSRFNFPVNSHFPLSVHQNQGIQWQLKTPLYSLYFQKKGVQKKENFLPWLNCTIFLL